MNSQTAAPTYATRGQMTGWMFYDWAESAFVTVIQTFLFAAYFTRQVARDEVTGMAQWGYMISVVGVIVAVLGPMMGAAADQMGRRKPWIGVFALLCIAATALLWFVQPSNDYVLLALVLVAIGTLGSEFSIVFYNAMLPALASPSRLGGWSGAGWAMGYVGGLGCLVAVLVLFVNNGSRWFGLDPDQAQHIRAAFIFVGAWHLIFSLPLFLYTPDAPSTGKRFTAAARDGMNQLMQTFRQLGRYRDILRFVIAKMIFINGLVVIFVFGGVYAAGTFDMTEAQVVMFGIALNVTAAAGAFGFGWVDDRIGGKMTILLAESQLWFWIFGLLLGVFVGPAQASSRSLLARIAPPEMRNQMFGLYALAGKATAFLGPLLVGFVTNVTQSQRIGLSTVLLFFIAGAIVLMPLPRDVPAKAFPMPGQ